MSLLQEFEKYGMNKSNARATAKNLKEIKKKELAKKMPKGVIAQAGKPLKRKKGESAWAHMQRMDNRANN